MRIGDYKLNKNAVKMLRGRIRLTPELIVYTTDENATELVGMNIGVFFMDLVQEECREEVQEFLSGIRPGREDRIITFILDKMNYTHLMDISAKFVFYPDGDGIELTLTDIDYERTVSEESTNFMWKYRVLLGMIRGIYFDYFMDDGVISFYRYVGKKSNRLFYGNFEEFRAEFLKNAEDDNKNIAACCSLCDQLMDGKSEIDETVVTGFLSPDNKPQKLRVRAKFDDRNMNRMEYGFISCIDGTEADLPYYLTDAGLDSMTGLLNKKSLIEYSQDIMTNPATACQKHYMILLDIDDFKQINDGYGHQTGDEVIQIIATSLADGMAEKGIVGRYGGDEFYILTTGINEEEDLRAKLRLIRNIASARAKEQMGLEKLTVSIGVSLYPDHGKDYDELLRIADKCLYIAKDKGKNRYIIYRPEMHDSMLVGAAKKGSSTYDDESKAINTAVRSLYCDGTGAIKDTMELVDKGFDLDSIDLFYGDELKPYARAGKYESGMEAEVFISNERYANLFNADGVNALGNYAFLNRSIPELYEYFDERKCMSCLQIALPSIEKPKFFISFNKLNRTYKWNSAEINYLSLYGSLLFDILEKSSC